MIMPMMRQSAGTIITDSIPGVAADNTTYTHTPDATVVWTVNALTGANEDVSFRQAAGGRQWIVRVNNNGSLQLYERDAPSAIVRASASSGSAAENDKVAVEFEGTNITVYVNGVQVMSYALASAYQTETTGQVGNVVYNNGVTDLTAYEQIAPSQWDSIVGAV